MFTYYFFYSSIILFFVFSQSIKIDKKTQSLFYFLFIITIIIFAGLRHQTGGDWKIYQENYINNGLDFQISKYNIRSDYGWELISYILFKIGFSIHMLNFISSAFFFISLNNFIRSYDSKLLVYIIIFPVIIIVLLMGFTRQAVAFSFLLLALSSFFKEKIFITFFYIIIGTLFHKSLILLLFIYFLFPFKIIYQIYNKKIYLIFLFFLLISLILTYSLIRQDFNSLIINYFGTAVDKNPIAQGAYQRWLINFIPSLLLIIFFKNFTENYVERRIFLFFSIVSIFSIILIPFFTTGIDRIMYYFSIIQIFVFAKMPFIFPKYRKFTNLFIILYYLAIFIIWINFSNHSYLWIPYDNLLFYLF